MRTRTSPRNQIILWRALTPPTLPVEPMIAKPRCWTCRYYPKGGRARGRCAFLRETVYGVRPNLECHEPR